MKQILIAAVLLLGVAEAGHANVYAYVNENGDYVVTQKKPGRKVTEYAVLSDTGEFVRLVRAREPNVPITHWRPWFIPREPDSIDLPEVRERTGVVEVDEVSP
jgi:hypothetical protein